jgi:error-prone DNA polymerase
VFEAFRPVVMGSRLISVSGVLQNERGVIHIVGERFQDLTPLLRRLSDEAARIDPTMPPDVIKRPIAQRHPRTGDTLVTLLKKNPAFAEELSQAVGTAQVMPKGRNFH